MSEPPLLPTVEIHPGRPADAAVVWLHGLGADGNDFVPVAPQLGLPEKLAVRFVFPHAPSIPVTLNGGFVMPAWYDISDLDRPDQDDAGVLASTERVRALVRRERERGVPAERIVLAGFSQGGAIALHAGLRHPERLAGLIGLSCLMVRSASLETEASEANAATPAFVGHGLDDDMVPIAAGEAARDRLEELGHEVEWHDYPMPHSVCMDEIADLGLWLTRVLG